MFPFASKNSCTSEGSRKDLLTMGKITEKICINISIELVLMSGENSTRRHLVKYSNMSYGSSDNFCDPGKGFLYQSRMNSANLS